MARTTPRTESAQAAALWAAPHTGGGPVSTRDETYRATMQVQSPEHGPSTLIVLRVGLGRSARTWVVLEGSIRCTAVLDDEQVGALNGHLLASQRRQQEPGRAGQPRAAG